MKLSFAVLLFLLSFVASAAGNHAPVAIAIHGGAGTILKENMTPEMEADFTATLSRAVKHGYSLLKEGKSGEEAVVSTIRILETSPLFNAGVGAVYTYDGQHELDASIMHGATKNAGAVAGVKTVLSPIALAQTVMNKSSHVMLAGAGAETFAREQGLALVDNSVFDTPHRLEALKKVKNRINKTSAYDNAQQGTERFGTVGAVVLDSKGNLVAGTSTGGMTAKRYGRIGDSPVIGAGTYADNKSCAVSATGHGEYFIRYHVAADICARVKYQKVSLEKAANDVINSVLVKVKGEGGVIALDSHGNITMPFNTAGMYRASINTEGHMVVGIYKHWQLAHDWKKSEK
ncbi:isoaspartyl peptidase/L-asparaginase family protein [Alteromonas sp. ASW11-130]|uniref:isoaspartyl peptidase/L-asparaginase family protein n=1 Tax=Alteromonas sp. ASW11-130 TaxID=3015775 RepID=UPI002242AAF1|nr:isoaspartyl peptidase/L-asparaginase [Alteromonas sp. ASW11-130]MCW8091979.1 isoaspartyl peptidase/L-asparaginase [Alteromonas sp. ASW11-130]